MDRGNPLLIKFIFEKLKLQRIIEGNIVKILVHINQI